MVSVTPILEILVLSLHTILEAHFISRKSF